MKIIILTDSLGLPREIPEAVLFDQTWVNLLRSDLQDSYIHQVSIGGATLYDLLEQYSYHKTFNPDLIIIQAGIVECAPRALTNFENTLLNINRVTKKIGNIIVSPWIKQLRKHRNIVKRSLPRFIIDLKTAQAAAENAAIIYIPIMPPQPVYETQVPGITKNVTRYNEEIFKAFGENVLNLEGFPENGFMSDHHHLNKEGHLFLFNKVREKIRNFSKINNGK